MTERTLRSCSSTYSSKKQAMKKRRDLSGARPPALTRPLAKADNAAIETFSWFRIAFEVFACLMRGKRSR